MNRPISTLARRACAAALLGALVSGSPAWTGTAFAYDENSTLAINIDEQGVALRGYDPVAYFTAGAPTQGDASLTAVHEGATYRFASAANRDTFLADPARYAPAFGGFCAMGTAFEKKVDGDPKVWRIVDGRLYVNVTDGVQKRWLQDVPGNIAKADANWPRIKDTAPKDL